MQMKRTVALTLSALFMLTLLFVLPVMPARAEAFTLIMGNGSQRLEVHKRTAITYINTSFSMLDSQTSDSWCKYDPATPNRLTLMNTATVTGYINAAGGNLDIYIENGVTLTLNAIENGIDPTERIGIRMYGGALSFFGTSGASENKGKLIVKPAATASSETYETNAAIYADSCPSIRLSGGCTVEATGGEAISGAATGDNSRFRGCGVYLNNLNATATLSLEAGSRLIAMAGGTPEGNYKHGVYVYSGREASILVSGGSQLIATGSDSSEGSRGVILFSEQNAHMLVEGAGSKLTGTSGAASAGNSYGVCIEVLTNGLALLQIENGGEVTGTGGNGYSSYGVYVNSGTNNTAILVKEGGALTGTGGNLGTIGHDGQSFGVYCSKSISVSGKLVGNGGDVISNGQSPHTAGSYGVYCGSGALTVDGGEVTGKGGAATAQSDAATGQDAIAEIYGVRAGSITLTGVQAVLEGDNQKGSTAGGISNRRIAYSYGVYSDGAITVGNTCRLTGTAGDASGVTTSYSYGVYSGGAIDVSGSLTGDGKSAEESHGVYTRGQNISVSGSLRGTSNALSGQAPASYGVITGKGKVTISGTVNAAANASYASIGISANGGIALTGNGRLTAETASATANARHCAKIPKNGMGANALTAGADAAWRGGSTATFKSLAATYNDAVPLTYLEVRNNAAFKVTPTSASVNVGEQVTLSAQGVADSDEISWYVSGAQTYDSATPLTGKTGKTLTFIPGSDHQTKYYFAKRVLDGDTFYSNIVPVTARAYGIELTPKDDYRFPDATVGYTAAPAGRGITVQNTGDTPTGSIAVTLSGPNANSFVLQGDSFADIPVGSNVAFSVQPKTNLGVGTHTATVTVGAAQGNANPIAAQSFAVSFTVVSAPLLNVEITPRDYFVKGDAPALTIIVGHGLPELTVHNLSGVAVTIDGARTALTPNVHYDASTGGSIHIALKSSWLNTLKPGAYPVDVALKGGAYEGLHVYTRFTVTAPIPTTGDNASPALWLCLLAGAGLALCALLWTRRKAKG